MNNKIYDIDHNKLIIWLTPNRLRNTRLLAFFQVICYSIIVLYQNFVRYKTAKEYQLLISPQVCYLQRLLNDRYDYAQRRIIVADADDKAPLVIFTPAELKPVYLGSQFIYTNGEAGSIKDDFVVKVPGAINFENAEMISLIKTYRLAGMKPKIQII